MKTDIQTTDIIFRKYPEGDIIAIFPHQVDTHAGDVMVYQHLGQHSHGDYLGMIDATKPASLAEANDLFYELKGLGYNIRIVTRQNHDKYLNSYKEVRGIRA